MSQYKDSAGNTFDIGQPGYLDISGVPPASNTITISDGTIYQPTMEEVIGWLQERIEKLEEEVKNLKADKILLEEDYE